MGRPKLYDTKLLIPVSDEQRAAWERAAAALGVKVTEFVRAAADREATRTTKRNKPPDR